MSKNKKQNNFKLNAYWVYGIIIGVFFLFNLFSGGIGGSNGITTTPSKFFNFLKDGDVKRVVIVNKREALVFLNEDASNKEIHRKSQPQQIFPLGTSPNYKFEFGDVQLFQKQLEDTIAQENLETELNFKTESNAFGDILLSIIPFVLIIGVWIFIMRRMSGGGPGGGGGQIFNIGKSKAKLFDEKLETKTTFEDVAGLEGAKEEVQEIVDFLKNPQKYTALGGKIPKGALLVGPPGTGKTLLAKAVAGEAKAPFFSLSGSDFVEMFVGVGASRVRDLFKQAKEKSPSIIFIDEIDAIGRARGKSNFSGSNDERENTLNQLLTEMDGFGSNTNVIVLAATNRADVLDKALMRAGRFDRQIYVDLPDIRERKEIFEVHLKPLKKAKDLDTDFLSKQTPGF